MNTKKGHFLIQLTKDDILCLEGDEDQDLYLVHSGKLMVCLRKRSEVTPVAYIGPGEYFGELSFFDGHPRSADVIAVEDSQLVKVPNSEKNRHFPDWLITIAQSMTKRLRIADDVIRSKGIRRKNVSAIQPMPIEEQGRIFRMIKKYIKEKQA